MNKIFLHATLTVLAASIWMFASAAVAAATEPEYPGLSKPGEKVALGANHYFVYGFDKQPKLGAIIMKVEIFTLDGKRDTSFLVKGDMDMPSMRGAHSTGEKVFSKSKKGFYLFPASIVMPGDWEFRFTFEKNGETVFRGGYLFDV
ncbi:MAG: hypothetical protein WC889_16025 [Myxococcota bacterium]|jgi:hypothetical protein